jgi:hypothetical protein
MGTESVNSGLTVNDRYVRRWEGWMIIGIRTRSRPGRLSVATKASKQTYERLKKTG